MSRPILPSQHRDRETGFSVLELLVALGTSIVVIGAVLVLFTEGGKMARTQTWVADMQDSLRLAQQEMLKITRMAGRGGLPLGVLPDGLALSVRNDAPSDGDERYIAVGDSSSPPILAGTDVLTVRGVIQTSIYQIGHGASAFTVDSFETPTTGSLTIRNPHPSSAIPQDLTALARALEEDDHPALLLVGPLDDWVVVEVDVGSSDLASIPDEITLSFSVGSPTGTGTADRYVQLSGGFPAGLRAVSQAGILEEHCFYVREDYSTDGDENSQLSPRLSNVRFYPNTEIAHSTNPTFINELADNIVDLQVAIGVDTDADGLVTEGADAAAKAQDDWLFNASGDVDENGEPYTAAQWSPAGDALRYLRITTMARTDRPDAGYKAPELTQIEDRDYSDADHEKFNQTQERRYRRRRLETVVDMRNL